MSLEANEAQAAVQRADALRRLRRETDLWIAAEDLARAEDYAAQLAERNLTPSQVEANRLAAARERWTSLRKAWPYGKPLTTMHPTATER